ncbi:MAG TPA: RidA family protein [Lachnoclostridium phytofermentans]|uniref:RidA family protein n=1 Tax=Lachnoclostridium phytofermentans TaxID=66219 RepID=A0A3D2X334_9FIRM|nr:RidA family protein [Lachnoclostridium sp.]HCL01386.1 RidA family protein [Lachnoclostridium phytofermentans]
MSDIKRYQVNEDNAWSEMVEAGDFVFLNFCTGNVGQSVEAQVHGAIDCMESNLKKLELTLDNVVKVTVLLRDAWNIPIMEMVFKERFASNYPARKTIQTEFAHCGGADGLHVQIDAIAYRK